MGVQLPHGEGDKEEERKVAQDSAAQRPLSSAKG